MILLSCLQHARVARTLSSTSRSPSLSSSLASQLRNPDLLQLIESPTRTPCDGTGASFVVSNPANPTMVLAEIPSHGVDEVRDAIARAQQALPQWRDGTLAQDRANLLLEWSRLIQQHSVDLARIMTLEAGKPLAESMGELAYGRSFLDWFAGEAVRTNGAGGGCILPTTFRATGGGAAPRGQIMAIQQAVGVCGLITPWNFPLAMITRKAGPALAAGCTAVIKPSELTPLTAIALQELAYRAGIPRDVLQVVTTNQDTTPAVGRELCTHPDIRKVSFTGSTRVGKTLMEWCSGNVKRLSLELGGNAPFIVFEDANLEQAVAAAVASKFRNAGQTCVCADRFLVHESLFDAFVEKLTDRIKSSLVVGDGLHPGVTMGPLITEQAAGLVHEKVQGAVRSGAKIHIGGETPNGHFYSPTILTHVPIDADIWKMETFGPVVAMRSFRTEEEALQIANDSRVGLAGYFCTNDLSRAFRFAAR